MAEIFNIFDHLKERRLDTRRYKHLIVDPVNNCATFALFNTTGKWVGYHKYSPLKSKKVNNDPDYGRYFTWLSYEGDPDGPREARRANGVWGLETVGPTDSIVFICEGVFKACRLHNLGMPAVAVFSNDPKPLKNWLWMQNKLVVAVCDPDDAGRKLAKYGDFYIVPDKPFDECTDREILNHLFQFARHQILTLT